MQKHNAVKTPETAMVNSKTFVCTHCRYLIEAESDGHSYFLADDGQLHFRSPATGGGWLEDFIEQSEGRDLTGKARKDFLAQRVGIMSDLLCLDCGSKFRRDLKKQKAVCPRQKCLSQNVVTTWTLAGKKCPSCKTGTFKQDEKSGKTRWQSR